MNFILDMAADANVTFTINEVKYYMERLTVVCPSVSAGGTDPHTGIVHHWFAYGNAIAHKKPISHRAPSGHCAKLLRLR